MARTTGNASDLITFSRASSGTALTKVAYGSELVTNGTFDADSDWNKSTNWVISGGVASNDGTSGFVSLSQDIGVEENTTYEVTFTVVSGTIYAVRLGGFTSAHQVGSLGYIAGTYTFLKTAPAGSNSVLYIASNNSAGSIDNISVREVFYNDPTGTLKLISHPTNKPRVEYDANGVAKGLLIEEARTNLDPSSATQTAGGWAAAIVGDGITPTTTDVTSVLPTGDTSSVTELTLNRGTADTLNYSIWRKNITITGVTHTGSIYLKAARPQDIGKTVVFYNNGGGTIDFVFVTLTDDWQRISSITDVSAASGNAWLSIALYGTLASTGEVKMLTWGSQQEAGSFPTSYIPTSGATATRSADIASVSVSEFGYNQAQGSVVVEMEYAGLGYGETNYNSVYIVCGTNVQRPLYNPQQIAVWDGSGAGAIANANHATNVVYKAASTWGSGSMGVSTDGSVPVFDNAYDGSFASITDFNLFRGNFLEGGGITGHLKSINYYPLRLSDAKLQSLTS